MEQPVNPDGRDPSVTTVAAISLVAGRPAYARQPGSGGAHRHAAVPSLREVRGVLHRCEFLPTPTIPRASCRPAVGSAAHERQTPVSVLGHCSVVADREQIADSERLE
jgi:hypothetical protein